MSQLKAGAVLNYVVIILNIGVGLLYTPYMLRMLGQNEYGLYSLVASVISYLTILDMGLGNAVVRYTAKFRTEGKQQEQYEMFGMFLLLYACIGVLALLVGGVLFHSFEQWFGHSMTIDELEKARLMILFLIFNVAFTFPMSIFGSILLAYERFVFPKVLQIIRILLNLIVMIVLLELGFRAVAMVVVQTIFNILTLVIHFFYCKYKLGIQLHFRRFRWGLLKEISVYSFWIFLSVIMDRIYWNTGQFVLGMYGGTAAIAVFAVAIQLSMLYMSFSTSISGVFLPKVTAMVASESDPKEISDLFIRTGRIQYIVMAFILSGFVVFGRPFIHLWAGADYADAYAISLLFFVSLTIPMIQNVGITILQARNRMKFRSLLYLVIAFVSLYFQFVLAKRYGGWGCAIAISAALFVGQGLIMNVYYHRSQGLDMLRFWKEMGRMSVVPGVVGVSAWWFLRDTVWENGFQLGLAMGVYTLVYLPLFFHYSMNQTERNLFLAPLRKIRSLAYARD